MNLILSILFNYVKNQMLYFWQYLFFYCFAQFSTKCPPSNFPLDLEMNGHNKSTVVVK